MATLHYPSKFVWLDGDGPTPSPEYVNKLPMMIMLNDMIKEFNNETFRNQEMLYEKMLGDDWSITGDKYCAPAFHTFGIRKITIRRAREKVGTSDHRWSWSRETEKVLKVRGGQEGSFGQS